MKFLDTLNFYRSKIGRTEVTENDITRFAWAGGTFFLVVLYVGQFLVLTGKKSSSRLSGGCVSFWFWREMGSFFVVAGNIHYDRKKKVPVVSQFLVLAGNGQFFCCGEKFSLRPEKKSSSRLSGGCVSF